MCEGGWGEGEKREGRGGRRLLYVLKWLIRTQCIPSINQLKNHPAGNLKLDGVLHDLAG